MRIVFMGSPQFALPSLSALMDEHEVVGVFSQPDRPAGRGRTLKAPPVKQLAQQNGVPVSQPETLKGSQALTQLEAWQPRAIVVAAYGQILPPAVLELPPLGCLNVHASLLPRWRGASPVRAAILHGDDVTGVTIMKMDEGLDTGPILAQERTEIGPEETAGQLEARLAQLGAEILLPTLANYAADELEPRPQDDTQATKAPVLKKRDGELEFSQPAAALERQVRAFQPWPGTFFHWQDQRLAVHKAHVAQGQPDLPAGTTLELDGYPAVQTAADALVLEQVQPAGKRAMDGRSFLNGAQDFPGSQVGGA